MDELKAGEAGVVVLEQTPFYAESGGQVGDVGFIVSGENRFRVEDTQKIKAAVHGQFGAVVSGRLKVGDAVSAEIDNDIRDSIMRNHSVTHLMHKALRDVLGTHVEQKGSLQNAELTRFDISHPQGISAEEIAEVERRVNAAIIANVPVKVETMSIEDAQKSGAMMLFGEKYGDFVRVITMATTPPNCAAAPTSPAPATSVSSKSSAKAASPQASDAWKPSPALPHSHGRKTKKA